MRICTRAKAPSHGCYPWYYRQRHPCSCLCGLHKQIPRAQGRSSVAPPESALQLHAPASRRVPHSVSQPTPPQSTSEPAANPRRHGLSNSVAPAARKRSASAATGACCAVTLRTAPCPLRSLALPARSLRGLRKPRSGSCSAGDEKNEKNVPVSIQLSHISHPCLRIQLATEFMALPGGYYMPNSREGRGRYGQIDSGLGQGSWPELPRDEYLA